MEINLSSILNRFVELDAIVVEGYDGVGKGKVLNEISDIYGVTPYRPDYNLWQKFDHRNVDRWKISGFFWDVYSHFYNHTSVDDHPMLFDRGVISGAVYNKDLSIAEHYKEMLRDMRVLHVYVTCSEDDYVKFLYARNPDISEEKVSEELNNFREYESRYLNAFNISEVEFIVYMNQYDDSINNSSCSSCGHYSYGVCRHPQNNCAVDGNQSRCELSNEREVQDNDAEMYSMQS